MPKKDLKDEDFLHYRLSLINGSDGQGIIVALVHMDSARGSSAYLEWEDAKKFADEIYRRYNRHIKDISS